MAGSTRRGSLVALAGAANSGLWMLGEARAAPSTTNDERTMMTKHVVDVPADNQIFGASINAFEEWGYSPAVRAGGLLFVAGVVGVRPDGSVPATVEEQADLAFRRTAEILRLEGLSLSDLVEMVSYHVDLPNSLKAFRSVKDRYLQKPFPTWTVLGVEALGLPELKIEVRSIAALKS